MKRELFWAAIEALEADIYEAEQGKGWKPFVCNCRLAIKALKAMGKMDVYQRLGPQDYESRCGYAEWRVRAAVYAAQKLREKAK
jgi:hypothetical protein